MHIVDYFVIAGYFALVMYLGYYSMKKVSNFDDYAVAGRSMPLPIFFAAIAATLCGGGATIGRISFMHTTGIIVFFALTGVVINQIFSGLFISGRVHNAGKNVYSLGDLYGIYYGRSGRLLSSVFGFLFCVGAFGVQILAMGAILQTATGISLIPAALIASIVTLAYTWSGGISIGVAIIFQDVFGLMIYMFKLWPSAILPPLMCGLLWGKISPYAGAPAVIAGGLSFFLWSDKVLGEPFGIPANFIGIGMNCLVLFFVHQKMKGHKPEGPFLPDLN